jgi:NAD(P)H-hydrate epimerase
LAVAQEVRGILASLDRRQIVILVGPGNNGGDGLVAARYLHDWGAKVHLYLCGQRPESDNNYRLIQERGITQIPAVQDKDSASLDNILSSADMVIDAMLGTGKSQPLEGVFRQTLERVKRAKETRSNLEIIAVDIPSGLDANTGTVDPACLSADVTVTFAYPKVGLISFPGAGKVGKLIIADIGIPAGLDRDISTEFITVEWVSSTLPARPPDANKGTFGKILVVGGSINYIGAPYLACAAAMRTGAGLVSLATPSSLQPILASKLTEVTHLPLPESEPGIVAAKASSVVLDYLPNYDVLLLGCGLGQSSTTVKFVSSILSSFPSSIPPNLILDADALNILSKTPQWWAELGRDAILTPHPGEMSRLVDLSIDEVQSDRFGIAREASARWQKTVVLKGAHTVVAAPDGRVKISGAANPGLASAGTGDVLAGVIAGLLAQGLSPFDAAACGVYLHGSAGKIATEEIGNMGVIASDLLQVLPLAIRRIRGT